ncbi:hypothetical protein [Kitasatospora griseola]|uniref:hypothetical protein n=1 Tax=Kitasatospora griseola TaxID=2064 RepID=UPI0037F40FA6
MTAGIENTVLIVAATAVWYSAAIAVAAVTAVTARTADRRRDAREVLKVLVRRNSR